jgi:hypothetical protein
VLWQQHYPILQIALVDVIKGDYLYYDREGNPVKVILSTLIYVFARQLHQVYTIGLELSYKNLTLEEFRQWHEQLQNHNYRIKLQRNINIPFDRD